MATRFISDAEIVAGLPPGDPMRRNPSAGGSELREQMRELMAQRPIDFLRAVFPQPRIQRNDVASRIGPAGGAEKARVPLHMNGASKLLRSERSQDLPRPRFQGRVAPENDKAGDGGKDKVELMMIRLRVRL